MADPLRQGGLVLGWRERARGVPSVVPAGAGPSATDLAGPRFVDAGASALSSGRPRGRRAHGARSGSDEVRRPAGRSVAGIRRSRRTPVLPRPETDAVPIARPTL